MVKKAITHLKLDRANARKLHQLDELAVEYQRIVQAYVDWLIAREVREPAKYADIPEADVPTPLSDRWQRCAWQQACGMVQSWYSNERETPPVLRAVCLQANTNVVKLEPSDTPTFDFWLKISTLDKGQPVEVPLRLYARARAVIAEYPKLCTGVTLNKRAGRWYATLVVERTGRKPTAIQQPVGVDIGMTSIATASTGEHYGAVSDKLARRVEKKAHRLARKQKLNACLKRRGLPPVRLDDHKAEAFTRNEIGRALNELVEELPAGSPVALERLNVKDMRFKSRRMNRRLRASQLGYIKDKLRFKLDEHGIRYRSVQAAYSSQQCSHCGFVSRLNRRAQAEFVCQHCGFVCHADVNAARNIAERFSDDELNALPFRDVEAVLAARFACRFSDARSASAGLDTRVNEVMNPSPRSISPVITPVS